MSAAAQKFTVKYKRNYVAFLAFFLFLLIMIGEIILAIAIPAAMKKESFMAEEANRHQLLRLFDNTRKKCNSISGKNPQQKDDPVLLQEKQLLADVLDRFARYMREHGDKMTPDEVSEVSAVLSQLFRVADRLARGQRFSNENRVDSSKYINALLDETRKDIQKRNRKK